LFLCLFLCYFVTFLFICLFVSFFLSFFLSFFVCLFLSFFLSFFLRRVSSSYALLIHLITLSDTRSEGLLWTGDRPVAETSTWQHTTFTIDWHPFPGGIRTRNLCKRATANAFFKTKTNFLLTVSRQLRDTGLRVRKASDITKGADRGLPGVHNRSLRQLV